MGPTALLLIREEGVMLILSPLKINRCGRILARELCNGGHANHYTTESIFE
jgi:hypothetical protein